MIPIIRTDYTTHATGVGTKRVRCEWCEGEYVYTMQMTGQGASTSFYHVGEAGARERSQAMAEASLAASLEQGCAIVPCPNCGHIQEHMVAAARRDRHYWMRRAPLPAALIAVPLLLAALNLTALHRQSGAAVTMRLAWVFWAATAAAGLATVGLPLLRRVLAAGYDPNAEPADDRARRGREFAVPLADFLARHGPPETDSRRPG